MTNHGEPVPVHSEIHINTLLSLPLFVNWEKYNAKFMQNLDETLENS